MKIRGFVVKLCAMIAKRKLKRIVVPIEMEIFRLGDSLILKAETKRAITHDDYATLEKYFSVHTVCGPDKVGPGYQWWYEKYLINDDGSYKRVRSGRYPYSWEK